MFKFKVFADPGHSWVKVNKKLLTKLNIADKISPYSYQRGNFAYLEEDLDLGILISAMNDMELSFDFQMNYSNRSSRIRNYNCYKVS